MREKSRRRRPRASILLMFVVFSVSLWNQARFTLLSPSTTQGEELMTVSRSGTTVQSPIQQSAAKETSTETYLRQLTQTFASCAVSDNCHILYWHIQKSGGTYLASRLYAMNAEGRYDSHRWCCNSDFMKKFRADPLKYCNKKFGVYEVQADSYLEVMETCQSVLTSDTEFQGFISIRQPLERTVSAIHQRCNHGTGKLPQTKRDICKRCSYSIEEDRPFYDYHVNATNTIFDGIRHTISKSSIDIPVWILDNADIDSFFESLEQVATLQLREADVLGANETFQFPKTTRTNAQDNVKNRTCDFGMTAGMMKNHETSLRTYRRILEQMALAANTGPRDWKMNSMLAS